MPVKPLVSASLLLALGVIVPTIFHMTGVGGTIFLPMHIPVLFAGIILGPGLATLLGLLCPILSHLLTGMPPLSPVPMLPIMVVELAVYGMAMGYLFHRSCKNIWLSLLGSMLLGRLAAGLTVAVIASLFNLPLKPLPFIQGAIVTGLPGILLQLVIIPTVTQRFFAGYRKKETGKLF